MSKQRSMKTQDDILYEKLYHILKIHHTKLFAKTKSGQSLYNIRDFIDLLRQKKFFEYFNLTNDTAFECLRKNNDEFYCKCNYSERLQCPGTSFYKRENDTIKYGWIISLKRNNFIEWLFDKDTNPFHEPKYSKQTISKTLRLEVWKKNCITTIDNHTICLCCFSNITESTFECGHNIAEKNGGPTILENLEALCKKCNRKMGSMNMLEYFIQEEKKIINMIQDKK